MGKNVYTPHVIILYYHYEYIIRIVNWIISGVLQQDVDSDRLAEGVKTKHTHTQSIFGYSVINYGNASRGKNAYIEFPEHRTHTVRKRCTLGVYTSVYRRVAYKYKTERGKGGGGKYV